MPPQFTSTSRGRGPRRVCFLERESDLALAETAIETQHHALSAEAARRHDRVVRVVVAAGYSGSLPPTERPDFEEILDAAEQREFDYVLATEIARVNRGEAYGYYYLKHELERLDVGLEFLDQQFIDDGESEVGALMEGFSVLLPSIEKRTIVRRFKRARMRVQEEGYQWVGTAPFGYEYVKGGQKKHQWRINPSEAEWVKNIFSWAGAGVSRRAIARRLQEAGVPTRNGGKWWPSTVSVIVCNPRYKGTWPQHRYVRCKASPERPYHARPDAAGTKRQHKKRLRVYSSHKLRPQSDWGLIWQRPELAIVDAATWERANDIAPRNRAASARRTREPSLLKGLIVCDHDHLGRGPRNMIYDRGNHSRPRYRCQFRPEAHASRCPHSVCAPDVEGAVWTLVCDLATEPEHLLDRFLAGAEQRLERLRRVNVQQAEADADVARYETALATLDVAHASGQMEATRYARASALAEQNLQAARAARERLAHESGFGAVESENPLLDALIERLDAHNPQCATPADIIRAAVADVLGTPTRAELEALDSEEKRRKVRCCVDQVLVGPEGVCVRLVLGGQSVAITDRTSAGSVRNTPLLLVLPLFAA